MVNYNIGKFEKIEKIKRELKENINDGQKILHAYYDSIKIFLDIFSELIRKIAAGVQIENKSTMVMVKGTTLDKR